MFAWQGNENSASQCFWGGPLCAWLCSNGSPHTDPLSPAASLGPVAQGHMAAKGQSWIRTWEGRLQSLAPS